MPMRRRPGVRGTSSKRGRGCFVPRTSSMRDQMIHPPQRSPMGEEEKGHGTSDLRVPAAEERVGDVAAVELPGGKQVEGRDEKTDPPGKRHGVQHDVVPVRDGADHEVRRRAEQNRFPERDSRGDPGGLANGRQLEPDEEDGDCHDGARDRPGGTDVHQGVPVGNGRLDLDEGAERPDERRGRDEVRGRHIDAVMPGGRIMSQLVDPEDG